MRLVGVLLVVLASTGCAIQTGEPSPEEQGQSAETPVPPAHPVAQAGAVSGKPVVPVNVLEGVAPTTTPSSDSTGTGAGGGTSGAETSGGMGTDNPNPSPWNGARTAECPIAPQVFIVRE